MARRKSSLVSSGKAPASLIRYDVDSLTQGVSQQPGHLRQVGQGTEQINGWSSPVNGLTKRRPTKYVGRILDFAATDFYLETMPVTAGERYSVLLYPPPNTTGLLNIQIIRNGIGTNLDVHGTGMSLVTGQGGVDEIQLDTTAYGFNADTLRNKYVLINNGPVGLLLNREKTTALSPDLTPNPGFEALVFVQAVDYDIEYTVTLNGTALPSFTTPKASDNDNQLSTDTVAAALQAQIDLVSGFTTERQGSVVYVAKSDQTDFTIQVDDSRSNALARGIKGSVNAFSELPTTARRGFTVKVEQDASSTEDDQWVSFVPRDANASFGDGTWQERAAPGIQFRLDEDTMPLVIYRAAQDVIFVGPADGATRSQTVNSVTYDYTFPTWGARAAGDEDTVPTPSFIGNPIKDHVLFRSRYFVVGGESVVSSEVDDIFNFFNSTATAVLETDPIDVRASSESSIDLNWILPVDESLLAFSNKSQFRLQAADADVLTPRTAIILRLSNIEMNAHLRPKIAGPNAVFATSEYGFTGFREYQFFDTQARRIGLNLGGSQNITLNVPKYISGDADLWDVGESLDYFVARSGSDPRHLFVYKYLWQVTQGSVFKQQSSWSTWAFDGDIQWARFFDNRLWMVMTYPDGTFTVTLEAEELTDVAVPDMYLDRQLLYPECNSTPQQNDNITATYDSFIDITTFTLPFIARTETVAVIRMDSPTLPGLAIGTVQAGSNTIVCDQRGDFRNSLICFGSRYNFEYTFTQAFVPTKDQARQRVIGELDGRLQVATWSVNHFNTGYYEVIVSRKNRRLDSVHTFRARTLNVDNNMLSQEYSVLSTGHTRVPIYSRNTDCTIKVRSDSWLPVTLMSACWEGNYNNRARSVG
jgi:hypothetical protein